MAERILKLIDFYIEKSLKPNALEEGGFKNQDELEGYLEGLRAARVLVEGLLET